MSSCNLPKRSRSTWRSVALASPFHGTACCDQRITSSMGFLLPWTGQDNSPYVVPSIRSSHAGGINPSDTSWKNAPTHGLNISSPYYSSLDTTFWKPVCTCHLRCGDMITIRILPCYREYFLATPIDSLRNPEKYQSPIFSVIDIVYPSILYVGYVLHVSM